ncbi:MAG: hypothetical protein ACTSWY_03805, partial [Promethearchaeota archaeon]
MKKSKKHLLIWILVFFSSINLNVPLGKSQTNETSEINFNENLKVIYKNEHNNIDENNIRTEDITKWNKIIIENIHQSEDKEDINVTWSLFEAVGVELVDLDYDDSLWNKTGLINYTSVIKKDDPLSHYGVLFNEKDTLMSDANSSLLLTSYRLFYMNEFGYFEKKVDDWGNSNNVTKNIIIPWIKDANSRTFEAYVDAESTIHLNSTYPAEENIWY